MSRRPPLAQPRSVLALAASLVGLASCGSPATSRSMAEATVRIAWPTTEGGGYVQVTTDSLGLIWSETQAHRDAAGPEVLRAVAEGLAGCGQAVDDVLDVRVHAVVGRWPSDVELLQVTPGAEACVRGVLSQIPLDADLSSGARYLAARVRVADLMAARPRRREPDCTLTRTGRFVGLPSHESTGMYLEERGTLAHRLTCVDDAPLTRLTLRYDGDRLVEATTAPPVPCVEAAAPELLGSLKALGLPTGFDAAVCRLQVPLR